MPDRLTLTLPPAFGGKEVEVEAKRFSVGRTPENDLVISDSSLSRRHALIENLDGVFLLSDCGSSNGTFINGRPVTAPAELCDWDVLTFGGAGDIVVRLHDDAQPAEISIHAPPVKASAQYSASAGPRRIAQNARPEAASQSWLSAPVIATSAAVGILLIAGLVLLATRNSDSRGSKPIIVTKQEPGDSDSDDRRVAVPTPNESTPNSNSDNTGSNYSADSGRADLSSIESYASKVLISISKDTRPVLTEKPLSEINAQVQRYKGSSSLRDELLAMKRAMPQVSASAKSNGLRTPLAVYATLARIDKDGGRGDPAQVAAQICPALAKMRAIFGDELANDSVLSVAALEEGAGLQAKITKLAGRVNDSPTTIRSIFYLHDHQVITSDTYDFVLRFLAIGVISQDPQKFGIGAQPLTF